MVPLQGDPCEPNDTPEEATPIELPFQAEGLSISPQGDRDLFSFELEGSALVDIDVDADAIGSPLDSVLHLLDSNGEEIGSSDDVDGADPRLTQPLGPGRYLVLVRGYGDNSTGPYNLKIEALVLRADSYEPNDTPDEASPIELPFQAENLSIFRQGDHDVFSFALEESALVDIDVDADAIGSPLDSALHLLGAEGQEIGFSDDADGADPHIVQPLSPGHYFVLVRGYEDWSVGPYSLKMDAETLGESTCMEGKLDSGDSELWNLGMVPPGTRILLSLEGPATADFDLYLHEMVSEAPLLTVTVGWGISESSQELISYEVQGTEPKRYLAQVNAYEGEGTYKLCWFRTAP